MPRPLRIQRPGGVYHVNGHAIHAAELYVDDADRRRWLGLLAAVVRVAEWKCLAYCLLGNHYHLLIRIEQATLSSGMQYLNSRHAMLFNQRHERRGHVFGARFHGEPVKRDGHALEVCRYIALNPVRAGLCARPEDWPWSSYAATVGLAPAPDFLDCSWVLGLFGNVATTARRRFRAFVEAGLELRRTLK